jgi:AcrR family transcriptional regulator
MKQTRKSSSDARARILRSAYRLFSNQGIVRVGVDKIVTDSGCAKATLYNNFSSKTDLALAFLEEREQIWTRGWLEEKVRRRTSDPEKRLLAIFELFGAWFQRKDFEGCSFINVLLESDFDSPIHSDASQRLANIRSLLRGFAIDAGLDDCEGFANAWHMLMKGSIVAAHEGNRNAANDAFKAGKLILAGWPRIKATH